MKKTIYLFALAGLSLAACGDNQKATVDGTGSSTPDGSGGSNVAPPPPTLGAQIDRLGRPAINTALNHTFEPQSAAQGSAKDAYNQDGSVGTWQQTWVPKFAPNLAIIDSVDTGVCGNGICESQLPGTEGSACAPDCGGTNPVIGRDGCGNVPLYAPGSNGSAVVTSYVTLAGFLADDQLYLDTSKTTCNAYLGLEFSFVTGIPVSSCGGRAPSYDVIDYSYSMLAMGLAGFNQSTLAPLVHDDPQACRTTPTDPACANHPPTGTTDTTFPFLAPPH
jgi:hypothetical protein